MNREIKPENLAAWPAKPPQRPSAQPSRRTAGQGQRTQYPLMAILLILGIAMA